MKKENAKKLSLNKIKIANLNQVQVIKNHAPTTTAVTSHFTLCYICPGNE